MLRQMKAALVASHANRPNQSYEQTTNRSRHRSRLFVAETRSTTGDPEVPPAANDNVAPIELPATSTD